MIEEAGKRWANIIRNGSTDSGCEAVIGAINAITCTWQANQADVILACAQIMGQVVASSGPEIATEIRQGIMAMIDGYALQVAIEQ